MMIAFVAVIIFLVYTLAKDSDKSTGHSRDDQDAMTILSMRYAHGEIDEETFLRGKRILKG